MDNDIDDTTDKTPGDESSGRNGGRRLRFWLGAAEALIARERAYGGRGVRERIEAAVPADDLDVTVRTLEAIARELGDEREVRAFGSRGHRRARHGWGPDFGGHGWGADFEGHGHPRDFAGAGFGHGHRHGPHGYDTQGHGFATEEGREGGPHGHRHGLGPHGAARRGWHRAC